MQTEAVRAQFGYKQIDDDPYSEYKTFNFWARPSFNRVEGIKATAGSLIKLLPSQQLGLILWCGYGIKNEKGSYECGMDKRFASLDRLILRFTFFDETATNDRWIMDDPENSLAGIFLREDFRDYFRRTGWRIFADKKINRRHLLRMEYARYEYGSMATYSDFAGTLFGGDKIFRANPAVAEGEESSLKLSALLDWRDSPYFPLNGWLFEGVYRKTFGDEETDGLYLSGYFYRRIWNNHRVTARAMLGMSKGSTAYQYLMPIGGVGSLRGFQDRARFGQNFAMLNMYYLLDSDLIQNSSLRRLPLMDSASLGVFLDIGDAWYRDRSKKTLLNSFTEVDWLADAGVSLLLFDGLFRADLARQILGGDGNWRMTFRVFNKL